MSILSEEEDTLNPNAYVKEDPKAILKNLNDYSLSKNVFKCKYKKNSHRITFEIPVGEEGSLDFQVIFKKGTKKSTKGFYKLFFEV